MKSINFHQRNPPAHGFQVRAIHTLERRIAIIHSQKCFFLWYT
ncbi:hypothetical protein OJ967_19735 [Peribacillus frigoritolerans]|nr:hypothetical protein [Peribacillus frigoritolerans]UYY97640.1 hypothetical protein OJ967_19735 [Peribacillus frigoritolerans]